MTPGDALVVAAWVLLLLVVIWLWIRQRRVERAMEKLRAAATFDKADTTWLLREALQVAEGLPRFAATGLHRGSRRKRGKEGTKR